MRLILLGLQIAGCNVYADLSSRTSLRFRSRKFPPWEKSSKQSHGSFRSFPNLYSKAELLLAITTSRGKWRYFASRRLLAFKVRAGAVPPTAAYRQKTSNGLCNGETPETQEHFAEGFQSFKGDSKSIEVKTPICGNDIDISLLRSEGRMGHQRDSGDCVSSRLFLYFVPDGLAGVS